MSRGLALASDLHLLAKTPEARMDNAVETALEKFEWVMRWCSKNGYDLVVAGDVTNTPRSWPLLSRIVAILRKYGNVTVAAVFGQHDTYLYSEGTRDRTILGILIKSGMVKLLGEKPWEFSPAINVYGCSYGQKVPKPSKSFSNILVIHKGISVDDGIQQNYPYHDARAFLQRHKGYRNIHCGDIHRQFFHVTKDAKRAIFNPGPLIRKEATEYNFVMKPQFYALDAEEYTFQVIEVPHKPAEEVLSADHIDKEERRQEALAGFLDVDVSPDEGGEDFHDNLTMIIESANADEELIEVLAEEMEALNENS